MKRVLVCVLLMVLCVSGGAYALGQPSIDISVESDAVIYTEKFSVDVVITLSDESLYNETWALSYHLYGENEELLEFEGLRMPLSSPKDGQISAHMDINLYTSAATAGHDIVEIRLDIVDEKNAFWIAGNLNFAFSSIPIRYENNAGQRFIYVITHAFTNNAGMAILNILVFVAAICAIVFFSRNMKRSNKSRTRDKFVRTDGYTSTGNPGISRERNGTVLQNILAFALIAIFAICITYPSRAHGNFAATGDGLLHLSQLQPQKYAWLNGEFPLWTSYTGMGTPLFEDPSAGVLFLPRLLLLSFSPETYGNVYYVLMVGAAGFFMYLFLKEQFGAGLPAFLGALVFMVSPVLGGFRKSHFLVYSSVALAPITLYFLMRYKNTENRMHIVWAALTLALNFFAGNAQYFFYTAVVAYLFLIFICREKYKFTIIARDVGIFSVFLLGFAMVQLLPSAMFLRYSERETANYTSLYSMNLPSYFLAVFPELFGNHAQAFGIHSAEISIEAYLGIVPLLYLIYAWIYHRKERIVRLFMVVAMIAVLYASCAHIFHLDKLIEYIPILNMFGVPSRILFVFNIMSAFCFAYFVQDLWDETRLRGMFRYSLTGLTGIVAFAIICTFMAKTGIPALFADFAEMYATRGFAIFGISILLALLNVLVVLFLYMKKDAIRRVAWVRFAAVALCSITILDLGQYFVEMDHANYDEITNTPEVRLLENQPNMDTSRIGIAWLEGGGFYTDPLRSSGLADSKSTLHGWRNINAWTEFEDNALNQLLTKTESRDGSHLLEQISFHPDLISMLGIRYFLIPNQGEIIAEPSGKIGDVLFASDEGFIVPGDGDVHVVNLPVIPESHSYYTITFDLQSPADPSWDVFYLDVYGETFDGNNVNVPIDATEQASVTLYTGSANFDRADAGIRIVLVTHAEMRISNVQVFSMEKSETSPLYQEIGQTEKYTLFENPNAREFLYIPDVVDSIDSANDFLAKPDAYENKDTTAYVENMAMDVAPGTLENVTMRTNSASADVRADGDTFIIHAQRDYPSWNAYIDGEKVDIHTVNGLLQGVMVSAGSHHLEFKYEPTSVLVGAIVSLCTVAAAVAFFVWQRRKRRTKNQ